MLRPSSSGLVWNNRCSVRASLREISTGQMDRCAFLNPATPGCYCNSPNTSTQGGPPFTLSVVGSNFTTASTVHWNGATQPTTFVNANHVWKQARNSTETMSLLLNKSDKCFVGVNVIRSRMVASLGRSCGFVLWNPIFVWRLALRAADSTLAAGRLCRRLPKHRPLYSLGTPFHSLLAPVGNKPTARFFPALLASRRAQSAKLRKILPGGLIRN